jgi:hypothetical protein
LVVAALEASRFDAPCAESTHEAGECTLRDPYDVFDLDGDPALARLARIAHAADSPQDLP